MRPVTKSLHSPFPIYTDTLVIFRVYRAPMIPPFEASFNRNAPTCQLNSRVPTVVSTVARNGCSWLKSCANDCHRLSQDACVVHTPYLLYCSFFN